ncbi:MAG: 30S ribosomal protein S16 [Ignavibacteria bacterium GWA2_35_9]|nr:MAG: 30S ribosomal protein S16 [Ignavibacteria bacterium GWA2_35_9]OGU42880.1 MAG: 30S ribosomal protein S16 [Ignavibacteria bacterium GWB2_36_8]OGU53187.1 MAG: 30S ribosomal protein S16 [Ignavibacteria bacterium GWC2_36_12]OGV02339.1 MAG: 30S ribosomal protein S16 [Ignavibacteria bacterium RIFOXYB2_FULL_36_7]OGV26055.1 MAG: 30S ribosomal protein S16 [Ignavibacteria bacterium RIFOXYA2_FULL_37_17]
MSVKLRLRRMGKKKQPVYKVVAADSRSPRDGKFLEAVGLYNPLTKPHTVDIKEDRVLYWLDKGAQPTDTVKSLLRQKGITLKRELSRRGLNAEQINSEMENWEKLQEAKLKTRTTKKKSKKSAGSEQQSEVVKKDENNEQSTAEVQGASEEGSTPKE